MLNLLFLTDPLELFGGCFCLPTSLASTAAAATKHKHAATATTDRN